MNSFKYLFRLPLVLAVLLFSCEQKSPVDSEPPSVVITAPANDSEVLDSVLVVAMATDNIRPTRVEFFVDGKLRDSCRNPPWQFMWHVVHLSQTRTYVLEARAYDDRGNVGISPAVNVVAPERFWNTCSVPSTGAPVTKISSGPNGVLFALIGGNVARSIDAGATWSMLTTSAGFSDFVIDSKNTLYAGANGVFRSTDVGSTWSRLEGDPAGARCLAIVANDYLLTTTSYGTCSRSTNGGQTWEPVGAIGQFPSSLAYNPKRQTVYAKTTYYGGRVNLWSSANNGDTWSLGRELAAHPGVGYPYFSLAVDSTGRLWILEIDGSLFMDDAFVAQSGFSGAPAFETDPTGLLLIGGRGFQYSTNGGSTWIRNKTGMSDDIVTAIGVGPDGTILVGTSAGKMYRSTRSIRK